MFLRRRHDNEHNRFSPKKQELTRKFPDSLVPFTDKSGG
ncbi:hypothetical protein [Azospirillum argentinense]